MYVFHCIGALSLVIECVCFTSFVWGARVDYWWKFSWYPATVKAIHQDGTVSVEFDKPGVWGSGARHVEHDSLRAYDDCLTPWTYILKSTWIACGA